VITIRKTTLIFIIFLISLFTSQIALADFSISTASQDFELDFSDLDDRDEELDFTHSIVITNDDSLLDEDVDLSVSAIDSDYAVSLSSSTDSSFTLASGESREVVLSIQVDVTSGINEGDHSDVIEVEVDGSAVQTFGLDSIVTPMLELDRILFHLDDIYRASMDDGDEGDSDTDVLVKPGNSVKMYFTLDNLFDNNYREGDIDGTITVELDDNNYGDDIDEEVDFILDAGENLNDESNEVFVEFIVPIDAKNDEFDVDITIEAQDENGAEYTIEWEAVIEVEREEDDVRIETVTFDPTPMSCDRQVTATINVRNFGADKQNYASVSINNAVLNLDLKENFEVDEGYGSDNTEILTFTFNVADSLASGTYPITVKSYYDFTKVSGQEIADLVVTSCNVATSTGTTSNSVPENTPSVTTSSTTDSIPTAAESQESIVPTVSGSASNSGGSIDTVEKVYTYDDLVVGLFVTLLILIIAIVLLILILGIKVASR
jgi:hypothetical protein